MAEEQQTKDTKETGAKVESKISIFKFLMDRDGVDKTLSNLKEAAGKQSGGFYKFPEGKQDILIVEQPKVDVNEERYQYSNGIGFVARIKEIDVDGNVIDVVHPLTLTPTRFWELAGQIKAVFPEWTPLIDEGMDIAKDLRFTADTGTYTVDGEERVKTRFAVIKGDNFVQKTMWIKEKINEARVKEGKTTTEGTGGEKGGEQKVGTDKNPW